jgi:DNA processing protein
MDLDTVALLRLVVAGGPVAPRRALLDAHGPPAAALAAGRSAARATGLPAPALARLALGDPGEAFDRALAWLDQPGHHLVGWHSADYPSLLRRVGNPPLALFIAGDADLTWHPSVAVVGSRAATAGGLRLAWDFAQALALRGFAVASGLAAGIDTAAHQGTLAVEGGRTIAVLGTGIDQPYPVSNRALYQRILDGGGAIISEHPPGTPACRGAFPSRNRILAGLSLGTLVVEAAHRSGALITARLAGECGSEVFAIPGSVRNPMARGCHRLIRQGAALVESPMEVIDALEPLALQLASDLRGRLAAPIELPARAAPGRSTGVASGAAAHDPLWQAIGHDPTGMDELVSRTGLTVAELSSMLLVMELEGRVTVEHGRWSRKSCQ